MLSAILHGKLSRSQENMEDILTSIVFGCLKYVDIKEGLLPFLSLAINENRESLAVHIYGATSAEFIFWPQFHENECLKCEPDIMISLFHDKEVKIVIFIEAKYNSLKSSWSDEDPLNPPNDQLAREWHNLRCYAERNGTIPFLLFVTQDYGFPKKDIDEAQNELQSKGMPKGAMYWLSWRLLATAFKETSNPILIDLIDVALNKYEFTIFEGITVDCRHTCTWEYKLHFNDYDWRMISDIQTQWGYKR